MTAIGDFATAHPWVLLGIYWLFGNVVSTMPSPKSGGWSDGLGYSWLFNLLHGVSGTIGRILAQYPATSKLTGQQVIQPPDKNALP